MGVSYRSEFAVDARLLVDGDDGAALAAALPPHGGANARGSAG
jgi:hypothetical protein